MEILTDEPQRISRKHLVKLIHLLKELKTVKFIKILISLLLVIWLEMKNSKIIDILHKTSIVSKKKSLC